MHATSFVLATAFALTTSVVAREHPQIYFPRQVKREIFNSTTTSPGTTSQTTETSTDDGASASSSTKRGLVSELVPALSSLLDPLLPKPSSASRSVKVIVIQSTVVIDPSKPKPTDDSTTSVKKTSKDSTSSIVIAPTGVVTTSSFVPGARATDSTDTDTSTSAYETDSSERSTKPSSSTKGGILDPINTLLSSLLPRPDPSTNSTLPQDTSAPVSSGSIKTTSANPTSTKDSPKDTTSSTNILDPLTSLLPPIGGKTSTTASSSISLPESSDTPNVTSTDVPPITTGYSSTQVTDLPITTSSGDNPVVNSTSTTLPGTPITSLPATTGPTDIPINSTSIAETASSAPTGTGTTTATGPATTISSPSSIDNSTVVPSVSETAASTSVTSLVQPTKTPAIVSQPTSKKPPVTSIPPTATFTDTGSWLPSTMLIEPTSMSYNPPTGTPTGSSSTGLPTNIPKIILPDSTDQTPPAGTKPIQIGFLFPLNYVFVASNTVAAAQIFEFLPRALSDAGGFSIDKCKVEKLVPYDSQEKWGYITTIAKLNYPETLLDTLQMDLKAPNSAIYNNENGLVRNLTALINTNIDLFGNVDGQGNDSGAPSGGDNSSGNDAFDSNDQGSQSSKQKATTAGIAVGAIGLSVMYGAAMFIVARRYKRKRQGHRRASSLGSSQASSEMRYNGAGSPALMGGALLGHGASNYGGVAGGRESHGSGGGSSARNAGISAPVATENSLGWN